MASNRDRLLITPGGSWRLYTHPLQGCEMLGTVQRGMEIGALAKTLAGNVEQAAVILMQHRQNEMQAQIRRLHRLVERLRQQVGFQNPQMEFMQD